MRSSAVRVSWKAVHPHARGDDSFWADIPGLPPGSPPRAWGRLERSEFINKSARFTPTRVGTIRRGFRDSSGASVHPHARGDDAESPPTYSCPAGSPPRAWGRFGRGAVVVPESRFTPTRVGTMPPSPGRARPRPVHPHARGDDFEKRTVFPTNAGSPPRAWGRSFQRWADGGDCRFTPTRVGTILATYFFSCGSSVHPHARGDDAQRPMDSRNLPGSPPRAWGRLTAPTSINFEQRFTPTRVGTIAPRSRLGGLLTVHPHARGDDVMNVAPTPERFGSPPRAWGRCQVGVGEQGPRRFTPTRVGTISTPTSSGTTTTVHPHARGDDGVNRLAPAYLAGSPPRAWGRCHRRR